MAPWHRNGSKRSDESSSFRTELALPIHAASLQPRAASLAYHCQRATGLRTAQSPASLSPSRCPLSLLAPYARSAKASADVRNPHTSQANRYSVVAWPRSSGHYELSGQSHPVKPPSPCTFDPLSAQGTSDQAPDGRAAGGGWSAIRAVRRRQPADAIDVGGNTAYVRARQDERVAAKILLAAQTSHCPRIDARRSPTVTMLLSDRLLGFLEDLAGLPP